MRRPTYPMPARLRPPLRHLWRHQASDEADLLFQVIEFADAGDRVNLLRHDGQRFTVVRNGTLFMVRDHSDVPIGTFSTVGECVAAGDQYLDEAGEARAQREADFGGDDHPWGAA